MDYQRNKRTQIPARLELAAALLERPVDADILEIGCGTGVLIRHLASVHHDVRLLGIDRSAKMVSSARGRLDDLIMTGRVTIEQRLLEDEPIGAFSRAVAVDVNGFWTDSSKAFQGLDRWLRPDASAALVFSAPARDKLDEIKARIDASDWLPGRRLRTEIASARDEKFVTVLVGARPPK